MQIEQLLQKFYEGQTSSDEERLLMAYFLDEEHVDERWKDDQQVFLLLHDRQIQVPEAVSEKMEQFFRQIEDSPEMPLFASTEVVTKSLPLTASDDSPEIPSKHQPRKRTLFYWIGSAAAVALLCIGLFFKIGEPTSTKMADTFSDPEDAALVAGQTLALISAQLNKGLDMAAEVEQEFEKVNQLLNKHLNK